jgi:hypothetical protein
MLISCDKDKARRYTIRDRRRVEETKRGGIEESLDHWRVLIRVVNSVLIRVFWTYNTVEIVVFGSDERANVILLLRELSEEWNKFGKGTIRGIPWTKGFNGDGVEGLELVGQGVIIDENDFTEVSSEERQVFYIKRLQQSRQASLLKRCENRKR